MKKTATATATATYTYARIPKVILAEDKMWAAIGMAQQRVINAKQNE